MTAGSNGDQQQELKGKTPPPPQNARNFQLPQKNNLREKLGTYEPPLSYVIIALGSLNSCGTPTRTEKIWR
jgi:hypothetical protein